MKTCRRAILFVTCLSVIIGVPSSTLSSSAGGLAEGDREEMMKVWERYARCLKSREFKPCFNLLSSRVLEIWRRDHGADTSERYADVKGTEELSYTTLKIESLSRKGTSIVALVRTQGVGEGGKSIGQQKFVFVKEKGQWRLDLILENNIEFLP